MRERLQLRTSCSTMFGMKNGVRLAIFGTSLAALVTGLNSQVVPSPQFVDCVVPSASCKTVFLDGSESRVLTTDSFDVMVFAPTIFQRSKESEWSSIYISIKNDSGELLDVDPANIHAFVAADGAPQLARVHGEVADVGSLKHNTLTKGSVVQGTVSFVNALDQTKAPIVKLVVMKLDNKYYRFAF